MTLPAGPPMSMLQVLDEIRTASPGRGLPISLNDDDVRALMGISSGPVSMSYLYGKSAIAALSVAGHNDYAYASSVSSGGTVAAYPSVTYTGGSGTKTIQWSVLSGPGTLTYANQAQCTVSRTYVKGSTLTTVTYLRCVVSDSTGSVTVDNIIAELNVDGNQ